jgi:hypothetical protein
VELIPSRKHYLQDQNRMLWLIIHCILVSMAERVGLRKFFQPVNYSFKLYFPAGYMLQELLLFDVDDT